MLKYLMKYDLKKMYKLLKWLYILSVVLAGITRLLSIWNDVQIIKIIGMVFSAFTYTAIINTIVNTFIHILMRFAHNFYKDESYLTHTLPVKKSDLILSKFLSSLIVVLSSVAVTFLSLFILFYTPEFVQGIKAAIDGVVAGFSISGGWFIFFFVLVVFAQICALMSFAFMAIVKGYSYNKNRGICGFVWFVLYYSVCSITSLILSVIVTAITGDLTSLFSNQLTNGAFLSIMIISLVSYIAYAILFYFICQREFKKGVNVDWFI